MKQQLRMLIGLGLALLFVLVVGFAYKYRKKQHQSNSGNAAQPLSATDALPSSCGEGGDMSTCPKPCQATKYGEDNSINAVDLQEPNYAGENPGRLTCSAAEDLTTSFKGASSLMPPTLNSANATLLTTAFLQ